MSRRWRGLLVLLALAALSPVLALQPHGLATPTGRALAVVLVVVQAVALWWMGVRPGRVTAIVFCAGVLLQTLFPSVGPGISLVVLSTFAWLRPTRLSLRGLVGALLFAVPPVVSGRWGEAGVWLVAALLAWSWGALGRARSARRYAEARRAVLEERARIAREVHDVLAHTVSVMVVQAAAADDAFDLDPGQAREAMRQVESAGRQALTELRWFLRAIRSADGEESGDAAAAGGDPAGGARSLADVDRLARTMSGAALKVTVRREGDGFADVPAGIGLSAYRIVQESLTNTLRHADANRAEVRLRIADGELRVEVTDNGRGAGRSGGAGAGHGIIGMRERASMLGGSFAAGPLPGGGFRVSAHLPLGGSS